LWFKASAKWGAQTAFWPSPPLYTFVTGSLLVNRGGPPEIVK
jgi:hypothetical protein